MCVAGVGGLLKNHHRVLSVFGESLKPTMFLAVAPSFSKKLKEACLF